MTMLIALLLLPLLTTVMASPSSILQTVFFTGGVQARQDGLCGGGYNGIVLPGEDVMHAAGRAAGETTLRMPELGAWATCQPGDNAGCFGPPRCDRVIPNTAEYIGYNTAIDMAMLARDTANAASAGTSLDLYRGRAAAADNMDSVYSWLERQRSDVASRVADAAAAVGVPQRVQLYTWLQATLEVDMAIAVAAGYADVAAYRLHEATAAATSAAGGSQAAVTGTTVSDWMNQRLAVDAAQCLADVRPEWLGSISCMHVWRWNLCQQSFMSGYCGLTCNRCAARGLAHQWSACVSVTQPTGIAELDSVHWRFADGSYNAVLPARDTEMSAWTLQRQSSQYQVLRYHDRVVYTLQTGDVRGVYARTGAVTYGEVGAAGADSSATSTTTLLPAVIELGRQCRARVDAAICTPLVLPPTDADAAGSEDYKYRVVRGCQSARPGSDACVMACADGYEPGAASPAAGINGGDGTVTVKCAGSDRKAQQSAGGANVGPSRWGAPWALGNYNFDRVAATMLTYVAQLQCRVASTPVSGPGGITPSDMCLDTRPAWLTASCATVQSWSLCGNSVMLGHCRRTCGECF